MNWLFRWRRAKFNASGATMPTANSAPQATSAAVIAKKIQGTERGVAADDPHTPFHEHIDGTIVLRERKQVGQADQRDECIDGEAPPDVGDPAVEEDRAEHERTHEPKDAHVHVTPRGDHEHEREDDDGDQFDAHGRGCDRSWSGGRRGPRATSGALGRDDDENH